MTAATVYVGHFGRRAERFSASRCRWKERKSGVEPSGSMNREVKHGKRSLSDTPSRERPLRQRTDQRLADSALIGERDSVSAGQRLVGGRDRV
jgi:hypothetical protein